ncbi:MAG: dihydroorotate dehydrogenase-like protein [Marinifilaceae bacterium]
MAKLNVNYMGLDLKNPIVVGASTLTADPKMAQQLEAAGAAAIVFKSLFEEQIQMERAQLTDELDEYTERHAEMISIFPHMEHAGPQEHLMLLKKVKESVSIPVIASLNCIYDVTWFEYAKLLEDVGVDALELNLYQMPWDVERTADQIEEEKVRIVKTLKERVAIPISVKLSPYYTNTLNFVKKLDEAGVDAFVLFNRLFQPEISTSKEKHVTRFNLSHSGDFRLGLRYVGLLHKKIGADLCGTNGIYTYKDVIQMLLSGADAVQMVSAIYKNKPAYISQLLKDIMQWMNEKGYQNIYDFKGKLSDSNLGATDVYYRAQYLDYLLKPTEIMKKYPLR